MTPKTQTPEPEEQTIDPVSGPVAEIARQVSDDPEVLVDLDEGASDRPKVRHGGNLYELAVLDDFSVRDQVKLRHQGQEFFRLYNSDKELTDQEEERLEELLHGMFDRVLRAPKPVKAKMKDGTRASVVLAFTYAPGLMMLKKQQQQVAQQPELETTE